MQILIVAVITSILVTSLFIVLLIAFQVNVGSLFGFGGIKPATISLLKDLITPISASFVGAGGGALLAFYFQNKKEERKLKEDEITAINITLLALQAQLNDVAMIKKLTILPVNKSPMRFLEIQQMVGVYHVSDRINMSFSSPLINLKKASLVQKTMVAEKRYLNVINLQKQRDAIKAQITAATQAAGINIFDKFNLNDLYSIIGPNGLAMIYNITENYISMLDDSIISLYEVLQELSEVMSVHYCDVEAGKLKLTLLDEEVELIEKTPQPIIVDEKDLLTQAGHKI